MSENLSAELRNLNHLINEIDYAYHEAALKLGLSDSAMMILYTICNSGKECLLSDIMRLSGISKQTVNSALRKLETDGIVYLKSAGGRKKTVCLTEKGEIFTENTVLKILNIEYEIINEWTKDEWEYYLKLNQRYLEKFKEKIKEL